MRCFFPGELQTLCQQSGLDTVDCFGDYDRRAFDNNAPKQILTVRLKQ